jgi:hypothetical protein
MERIVAARRLAEAGESQLVRRGLAMPDSLIDWLINVMLDAQSWNNVLELNRDLIVLVRERLGMRRSTISKLPIFTSNEERR